MYVSRSTWHDGPEKPFLWHALKSERKGYIVIPLKGKKNWASNRNGISREDILNPQ